MKLSLCAALVVACLVGQAQEPRIKATKRPPIPPMDIGPAWLPAKASALGIAKMADFKVASLAGVKGSYSYHIWYGQSAFGMSSGDIKIRDNRTFEIGFEGVRYTRSEKDDEPAHKMTARSDGKSVRISGRGMDAKFESIKDFRFDQSRKPSDWALGMSRAIFGGVTKENPLTRLVTTASRSTSGYRVGAYERSIPFNGHLVSQQRLLIERTPEAAKQSGPIRIEIVVDFARGLPVSARVDSSERGKQLITQIWGIAWHLKKTTFTDRDFTFPRK